MEDRARQRLESMQSSYQALLRTAQEKLQQLRIKQGRISAQLEASGSTALFPGGREGGRGPLFNDGGGGVHEEGGAYDDTVAPAPVAAPK